MPPKDLPGFYFDPEKNRYFPIKGPLPGRTVKRPPPPPPSEQADKGCQSCGTQQTKRAKAAELLQIRELHGRVLTFNKRKHSFEQVCRDVQASNPMVWMYQGTDGLADSALEQFQAVFQTSKGLQETSILSLGSISGAICFQEFGKVGEHLEYGSNSIAMPVWPPTYKESKIFPASLWGSTEASTNFPCSVSSINKIGKPNDDSLLQNGLVSTLGCGGSGGSLYVLNLTEPLDFGSTVFSLQRRILKVASLDCTLWTAVCNHDGTQAAVGTNLGAGLINLESGRVSWIYRSKSDIFSHQFDNSGNVVICGLRNGSILAIDIRQKHQRHSEHFVRPSRQTNGVGEVVHGKKLAKYGNKIRENSSYPGKICMPSAVCSLVSLTSDDQYFLGSSMDGSIMLFDRRLSGRGPVQSYEGHVNSHSHLQLGVNPSETLFLSGGEDCYVRIWNIKTAELLYAKRISRFIPSVVCWRQNGLHRSDRRQLFDESPHMVDQSWGAWLGSREGVFYMHGT